MSRVADRLVVPMWLAAVAVGWLLVFTGHRAVGAVVVTVALLVVGGLAGVRVSDVSMRRGLGRVMARLDRAGSRG